MELIDQLLSGQCYTIGGADWSMLIPNIAMVDGGRNPPNRTFERAPGSSVEFPVGDGVQTLRDVIFSGFIQFRTEVEKDLFVASLDAGAAAATWMAGQEKRGPMGKAPGFAKWTHGKKSYSGILTVTLSPTARPQIDGVEVDW